ncbi:choice-of-anchor D domain-containing protein, partial [bacterium]|nr:choice-of-anchor D domain-containing protein [bacterium]
MFIVMAATIISCGGETGVESENIITASIVSTNFPYTITTILHSTTSSETITLKNAGEKPAESITITMTNSTGGVISIGTHDCNTGGSLEPGEQCSIPVNFAPPANGSYTESVTVEYYNFVDTVSYSFDISGYGANPANLFFADTPTFNMGLTVIGNNYTYLIELQNIGEWPSALITDGGLGPRLTYSGGGFPGTNGSCGILPIVAGTSCFVEIAYSPLVTEVVADTLSVDYNDGYPPTAATNQISSISISGTSATPADIDFDEAPSYDFSQLVIGTSANNIFTIRNLGGSTASNLTGGALAPLFSYTGGVFPGAGGDCTNSLPAGAFCTVDITFNPTANGNFSTPFLIAYNDGVSGIVESITLTGEGLDPAELILSEAPSFSYGDVLRTGSALKVFTLNNVGGNPATAINEIGLAPPYGFSGGAYPGNNGNCPLTFDLANGANCLVEIEYNPTAYGTFNDTIEFQYNNGFVLVSDATRDLSGTSTEPSVTLVSPSGTSAVNSSSVAAFPFTGTCSQNAQNVTVSINAGALTSTAACTTNSWSLVMDLSAIPDGAVNISVDHQDALANPAPTQTLSIPKDVIPPNFAYTSPLTGSYVNIANSSAIFPVSGTCDDNTGQITFTVDGANAFAQVGGACDGANFSGTLNTTTLPEGSHNLGGDIIDAAGNIRTIAPINIIVDTDAPVLSIQNPADGLNLGGPGSTNPVSATYAIDGPCSEAGQTVSILVNAAPAVAPIGFACDGTSYSGTIDTTGLIPDGTYTFEAQITDVAGNSSTSATNNIVVDQAPPSVAITTPADSTFINIASNAPMFAVSGTCDVSGVNVLIQVDGVDAISQVGGACDGTNFSATIDTRGFAAGLRAFTAIISDPAGNQTTSAANNITYDVIAPSVVISAPLDNSFINNVNDSAVFAVNGTCDENGVTVSVLVDGVAAASQVGFVCDGANFSGTISTTGLATGSTYVLSAEITDLAGNPTSSAGINLIKDTSAPSIAINPAMSGTFINLNNDSANFTVNGTCSENSRVVSIEVDAVPAASPVGFVCNGSTFTGTIDTTGLGAGALSFTAIISDISGNQTTSSSIGITKDIIAPTIALTTPANSSVILAATDSATFAVDGTCSELGQTVSITTNNVAAAGSIGFVCDGTNFSGTVDSTVLVDGNINFRAVISDVAGNPTLSNINTILKDTIIPNVGFTITPVVNIANENAYLISGSCSENGQTVTIDVGGVPAVPQPTCGSGVWSVTVDTTAVLDNVNMPLTADMNDPNGNPAVQATTSVIKDTQAPTIAITSSPTANFANASGYTVSGTCDEGTEQVDITIGAQNFNTSCVGGATWSLGPVDITLNPDNVALPIDVNYSDFVGNPAATASTTIILDTTAPALGISTPANGSSINIAQDSAVYTVSGTCNENGQLVTILIDTVAAPSQVGFICDGTNFTGTIDTTGFVSNTYSFTASMLDPNGNPNTSSANVVTKDIINPSVAITSPVNADFVNTFSNNVIYSISGTCSEAGRTVNIEVDGNPATTQLDFSCDGANFTGTIDITVEAPGPLALTAIIDDAVGNSVTSVAVNIVKDITPPVIAITNPANLTSVNIANDSATFTVDGTCDEAGQLVTVLVDGAAAPSQVGFNCDGVNFTGTIDSTVYPTGNHDFTASISDPAGNNTVSGANTVIKDITAPVVTINSPLSGQFINIASNTTTYSISGSCNESGRTVSILVNSVAAVSPVDFSCVGNSYTGTIDVTGVGAGAVTLEAVLDDASANVTTSTAVNLTKDIISPTAAYDPLPMITSVNASSYGFTGTCSENTQEVSLNIAGIIPATQPTCTGGTWSIAGIDASVLADSPPLVTIQVTHLDAAGNPVVITDTVTKDTVLPVVTIDALTLINLANRATYSLSGTCTDNGQVVTVDIGGITPPAPTCGAGVWNIASVDLSALADSPPLVAVSADHVDTVGNVAIQATSSVTKDTVIPTITINALSGINEDNANSYSLSGTCSENGQSVTIVVGTISPVFAPVCSSNAWAVTGLDVSSEGDNLNLPVTADITDASGNPATQATSTVVKDVIDPNVAITTTTTINNLNRAAYTVSGTCDANGQEVTVSVGGEVPGTQPTCSALAFSVTFDVTGAVDSATLAILADHVDVAGNAAAQASQLVIKDTIDPNVALDAAANVTTVNEATYSVSGTCSESGLQVTVTVNQDAPALSVTPPVQPTCGNNGANAWVATNIDVSAFGDAPPANITITADHNDPNGNNATQATTTTTKDTTIPTVAFDPLGPVNEDNVTSYSLSGTCTSEIGQEVVISFGGLAPLVQPTCTGGGTWSLTGFNVSSVTDSLGVNTSADTTDTSGNPAVTANVNILKDVVDPTPTITSSPTVNSVNEANYAVAGNCETGLTLNLTISDGVNPDVTSSTPCPAGTYNLTALDVSALNDSAPLLSVVVDQTDVAGNPGSTSSLVVKDTVIPTVSINALNPINAANQGSY